MARMNRGIAGTRTTTMGVMRLIKRSLTTRKGPPGSTTGAK